MLDLKYLPVHFSFFLIIGILIGYEFNLSSTLIFGVTILSFILLINFYFKATLSFHLPLSFSLLSSFLFINIGIITITIQKPSNQKKHYLNHLSNHNNNLILQVRKILKPNDYSRRFEVDIIQVNETKTKGKVLIYIHKDSLMSEINIDDILFTNSQFKSIKRNLNPYQFNYKEYLKKNQIYHKMVLNNEDYILLKSTKKSIKGYAHHLRVKINEQLEIANFSKEVLSIVNALLLGQRQGISKELLDNYKNAGAMHILAVSGLHIGVILLILNFLLKPIEYFKKGKILKLILVLLFLWVYAILTGLSASVIRAVIMFSAIAIGMMSNRQFGVQYSLVFSFFIILLAHPLYLFNVGFQLSYTAVLSIVWLQPKLQGIWRPKNIIIKYFWSLLTVTFAAQIGVLPLSLYYFYQFPGLFFVTSLVIIPFLGFILGAGFLIIILSLLKIIPPFLITLYERIIKAMNDFVAFISHQESFIFQNIVISLLTMFSLYFLLISGVTFIKKKTIMSLSLFLIVILCLQLNLISHKRQNQITKEFIVFNQSRNSIYIKRIGNSLTTNSNLDSLAIIPYSPINSYLRNHPNLTNETKFKLNNIITIGSKTILIIDSLGVYNYLNLDPDIIILKNSPKINMDRLLQVFQPEIIIVDGSNYKSFTKFWEKSCKEKSIPFYNTAISGAFVYNF